MENTLQNDRLPSKALEATGWYTCVSDIHRKVGAKKLVFGQENESWLATGRFSILGHLPRRRWYFA
jgi:hypothetical protein